MKHIIRILAIAVISLISLSLLAQAQSRPTQSSQGDRGRTTAAPPASGTATASSAPTASARPAATSTASESARSSVYYGSAQMPSSNYGGGSYYTIPTVVIRGTSYYSYGNYVRWQDFLFSLNSLYRAGLDGSRFLRNSEPLVTPRIASLAVRRPLQISAQLVAVVDELSNLLAEARTGRNVDKKAIDATAEQIRKLAKSIRTDPSLSYIDQRNDVDLTKGMDFVQIGLEAIDRLREIALDLNNQLHRLSDQAATSTISVDYLTRPSFESLSKGIEKLSKAIQNSARRL